MFRPRFLPFLIVSAAALLLVGWSTSHPASDAPAEAMPPPVSDREAGRLLDEAIRALDPKRIAWVETAVWQKAVVGDLAYEVEGRYLAGPDRRFRLELRTRQGGTDGLLCVACDGTVVRQGSRMNGEWAKVQETAVKDMLASPAPGRSAAPPPDEFRKGQLAGGMAALVRDLRQQLVWVRKETVRRAGRHFYKLTGVYPAEAASSSAPRMARLYLDPKTLWPHRLEWWGADPPRPGNVPLMQTEFRDPLFNRPPPPDRLMREFTLDTRSERRNGPRGVRPGGR